MKKPSAPSPDWKSHPFSVDRSVLFRMIRIINYVGQAYQHNALDKFGLSRREWRVLLVVGAYPGASAAEVSEISGYSQMAVSRAVRGLINQGRLRQDPDPDDKRRTCLSLTEKGWAVYGQLIPVVIGLEEEVLEPLTATQRKSLDQALDRAVERITTQPLAISFDDDDI